MAKIILMGEKEPIEIREEKARDLQRDIVAGKLPEFINVGGDTTIRTNSKPNPTFTLAEPLYENETVVLKPEQ